MLDNLHINKCIYCGGIGTTNEHIIPYALGGKAKLFKASCEKCRDITSRCEKHTLKENWAEARAILDYPSRKRDFGNETFLLEVTYKNGENGIIKLLKNEVLGLTIFLEYPLPIFFSHNKYEKGIIVSGASAISFGPNPNIKFLSEKYNIKRITHRSEHNGNDFEIMIAKIAYCASIAFLGNDSFDKRFVLPAIIRKKDDIGYWVGCDNEGKIVPLIGKQKAKNLIKIGVWQRKGDDARYVVSRLKFFANSDAPEYIVVVGTLKSDFVIPQYKNIDF